MNYIEVHIPAKEEEQDLLIGLLSDMPVTGFEQTDSELIACFKQSDLDPDGLRNTLSGYTYTLEEKPEQNWNQLWESNFEPVRVDDFCGIRAEFHPPFKNVKHEIVITPKMSFGTGHHATTYMMVQQMESIPFTDKKVFDFGTGTGILAILAEMLGASVIEGIDVDTWSIENAEENTKKNNCSKISVSLTSKLPQKKFDIILANINRNVILQYLNQLINILNYEGYLLLSGILVEDLNDIRIVCENLRLSYVKTLERNNWASVLFRK